MLLAWYWVAAVPFFTKLKWEVERIVGLGPASVLPFGTFLMDGTWLR